jgi:putative RNA 2'-phosphotransferase
MSTRLSKYLALLLRHQPELAGLTLDEQGWVSVDALLKGLTATGHPARLADLELIVAQDQKQRYSIRNGWIRANQGHSVSGVCAVELVPTTPPEVLYHGTTTQRWQSIRTSQPPGLKPGSRHHVHLSHDLAVAKQVGSRHRREELVVLQVDAKGYNAQGGIFYRSENGVWLTDFVPLDYLAVL